MYQIVIISYHIISLLTFWSEVSLQERSQRRQFSAPFLRANRFSSQSSSNPNLSWISPTGCWSQTISWSLYPFQKWQLNSNRRDKFSTHQSWTQIGWVIWCRSTGSDSTHPLSLARKTWIPSRHHSQESWRWCPRHRCHKDQRSTTQMGSTLIDCTKEGRSESQEAYHHL